MQSSLHISHGEENNIKHMNVGSMSNFEGRNSLQVPVTVLLPTLHKHVIRELGTVELNSCSRVFFHVPNLFRTKSSCL